MPAREWSEDPQSRGFYQSEFKHLSRIAKKLKLPKDLIEDAVQETLVKVLRKCERHHEPGELQRLQALSGKILHDTVADLLRQRDRQRSASLHDLPAEAVDDKASNPAEQWAAKEFREWVKARLEDLRQEHSQYAWLLSQHFLNERPIEELAAEKGVSKHALECQKTRAHEAFRRLLEKHGIDGEFLR